ncbi:hypothetical protein HK097_001929 [Rhizophlyctis rosea]|uniref:Elongation of fatty acids protein n=1 Tax=Rhizophlyctis rosea TaxID=64517 RepID=A0AAD5SJQ8_9FUNG|nr:hypothetical protein HK097_001929 [Rhizophlyctis rosea]
MNITATFTHPDAPAAQSLPLGALYPAFTNWRVPVITALIYFVTVKAINPKPAKSSFPSAVAAAAAEATSGSSPAVQEKPSAPAFTRTAWFKTLVVMHNIALCVFSGVTFLNIAPVWVRNLWERPGVEGFCDKDSKVWEEHLFYWSWFFYLSKYYEIFDTIIILLKGRRTSLLQSYHHAGAIISMYLCVTSRATATWIFVLFNSFIHTLMYCYYTLTTLNIRPPQWLKKNLTSMQITQFLVGGLLAVSYPLVPGCLKRADGLIGVERVAYGFVTSYLVPLTALFVDFARRAYGKRKADVKAQKSL